MKIRTVLLILLIAAVAIQLVPVDRSNPPAAETISASAEVQALLKRSCWDCHSNETVWPWYSRVAPVSWMIARHVNEGREELNFSTWDAYSASDRRHLLEESYEMMEEGEMPLTGYLRLHPSAELSPAEIRLFGDWIYGDGMPHNGDDD